MGSIIMMTIFWIVMWKTALGSFTVFNPWVNSYTSIVFNILFIILMNESLGEVPTIVKVFWISAIIDRIWDIRKVSSFDEALDCSENFTYRIKVMVSFYTFGLGRAAFLLWQVVFIPLILAITVRNDVKLIKKNKIMPQEISLWYSYRHLFAEQHYRFQYYPKLLALIEKKIQKGIILSNKQIVDEVIGEINKKEKSLPAKEMKKKLKVANKAAKKGEVEELVRLTVGISPAEYYAYIDAHFYGQCKERISQTLLGRGTLSPNDIMPLVGLDNLVALHRDALYKDRGEKMVQYFVLYILKILKQEGVVKEERLSDDIWDAYQYTHVQGASRVCINADDDPRFALDDD